MPRVERSRTFLPNSEAPRQSRAFVAQTLNRDGYTVYCPLLVGHGESKEVLNSTKCIDWYKSVEEAHDALKQPSDVIIVGGLSAGVLLALHLAAERPQEVHGTG